MEIFLAIPRGKKMVDFSHCWILLIVTPGETPSIQFQGRYLKIVDCTSKPIQHRDIKSSLF
jgi:hypothetical protein